MKRMLFVIALLLCAALFALPAVAEEMCYHDAPYEFDAVNHWAVCKKCGVTVDQGQHGTFCTDDGTCSWCDYTGIIDNVLHPNLSFSAADEGHWEVCKDCNQTMRLAGHSVPCGRPGVCVDCGAQCDTEPFHYTAGELIYDADWTQHWWYCDACGEQVCHEEHRGSCVNPTVCEACGREFKGDRVNHDWSQTQYEFNQVKHWAVCGACGEIADQGEHGTFCTDDGTCSWCEYTGIVDNVLHLNWRGGGDAESHWEICTDCGLVKNREKHYDQASNPGVCRACGAQFAKGGDGAHTHAHDETARTKATCGAAGEITYTCACGDSYTREIPALAHEYETTALRQPTCAEQGFRQVTCKHCGDEIRTYFSVVDHNYKVISQIAPSDGQHGKIVSACMYCGKEVTRFTAY